MKVPCFFYLLVLSVCINLNAQLIQIPKGGTNFQITTQLIQQERSFDKDTLALKKHLQPLIKSETYLPIYNGLLANGYVNVYDNIFPKSTKLYLKAIEQADATNNKSLRIWTRLNYVKRLYQYRYYQEMQPVLLELMKDIRQTKETQIINPLDTYQTIGWIMQTLSDYQEADYYLTLALKYCEPNSANYAAILDNYGINLYKMGRYKEAIKHFDNAGEIALKVNDSLRYAKTIGNKAIVLEKQNNYAEAITLLKQDVALSKCLKAEKNIMFATTALASVYLKNNNVTEAEAILKEAEAIAASKPYFRKSELEVIELKLELLKLKPDAEQELITARRLMVLKDSLSQRDGDEQVQLLKWQVEKDKYQQKIEQTNTLYQNEIIKKNIFGLLIGISVLGTIGLYFFQKKKHKKRQEDYEQKVIELEIQKLKMEEKLKTSNKSFSSQVEYLKNKNLQINQLIEEIKNVETSASSYLEKRSGKLHALLESHLMTEDNWSKFKREFEKEFPDFCQYLIVHFPELTDSNKRIVFLQKLGFNNVEISQFLGITTDAVKKAKQRMKKKLGDNHQQLFAFIPNESKKSV